MILNKNNSNSDYVADTKIKVVSGNRSLQRKKSLSTSNIPLQNSNFLCVPGNTNHQLRQSKSFDTLSKLATTNLKKIASDTSLVIPEDFSFTLVHIHVYNLRWTLLILCVLSTAIIYMQWIQYSIITNIIMEYYNVDSGTVDWSSMIFMVVYIICVFPVSYYINIRELRGIAIIGIIGTALGSWIKVFSIEQHQFPIALLGQGVLALSHIFIVSIPPRLANHWFSPEQMSTVCGFGVFGSQFGLALGFVLTPFLIGHHENKRDIFHTLQRLHIAIASFSTVLAVLIIALFQSLPEHPPSHMEAIQRCVKRSNSDFWAVIKRLVNNQNFMILVIAYGLNVGICNALSTLLNQIVLNYFPNCEQEAGNIGLALIMFGMLGSLVLGYFMDTTHDIKNTGMGVCKLTTIAMILFCLALESKSRKLLSIATFALGFFMTGFQAVGYEFAAELTFPEPDGPVSGIMNISTHIFGVIITIAIAEIQVCFSDLIGNLFFAIFLSCGIAVLNNVKSEMKRHYAHTEISNEAARELAEADLDDYPEQITFRIDKIIRTD